MFWSELVKPTAADSTRDVQAGGLILAFVRKDVRAVSLLGLVTVGIAVTQLAAPYLISRYIDGVRQHGGADLSLLALLYFGTAVANPTLAWIEARIASGLAMRGTNRLRAQLLDHCLRLDISFHESHRPGEMIERIDGDVGLLGQFFSTFLVSVAGASLLLIGMLGVLVAIDWRIGSVIAVFAAVGIVALLSFQRWGQALYKEARRLSAEQFGLLEEFLGATEDLRANGGTRFAESTFAATAELWNRAELKASVSGGLAYHLSLFFFNTGTSAALAVAASLVLNGHVSLGTSYLIFSYANAAIDPLQRVTQHVQYVQSLGAALARLRELLSERATITDPAQPVALPAGPLAILFDAVDCGYGDENVLHEVSFELPAGSVLGIVGRSGSGKTTIGRLVARLIDVRAGCVSLAGAPISRIALDELKSRVTVVTQDVQLMHGTLRDNVTLFRRSVPDSDVVNALRSAGHGEWLSGLPDGLDHLIAPGGSDLSAGQAQLLALARAFLGRPDVVVLDEASSRLDNATEARLEVAMNELLRGRTAILIAHRLATVQRCDFILVLEGGRVVEFGRRASLEADPGSEFARLRRHGLEEVLA